MKAFTQGISKKEFVKEMKWHQEMDHFMRGTYDKGDKACSVGCALKSVAKLKGIKLDFSEHKQFENHLGVPEWLARLNDTLFENVSKDRMRSWPVEFSEAINEGSDLEAIKTPFLVIVLESSLSSMRATKFNEENNPDVVKAIDQSSLAVEQMIVALRSGDEKLIEAARSAAWSAARSAQSAAWSAARSAQSAAESAAWSAARSAQSAQSAAESAARSAAWSARSAAESAARSAARSAAWSAAWSSAFDFFADELLKLMRECK